MGEPLARGELAALAEERKLLIGSIPHTCLERAEALDECQHLAPVGPERLGIGIDVGLDDGHRPRKIDWEYPPVCHGPFAVRLGVRPPRHTSVSRLGSLKPCRCPT